MDFKSIVTSKYAPVGFFAGGIGLFLVTDSFSKKKPSIQSQVAWSATIAGAGAALGGHFNLPVDRTKLFLGLLGGSLFSYDLSKSHNIFKATSAAGLSTLAAVGSLHAFNYVSKYMVSGVKSSGLLQWPLLQEALHEMEQFTPKAMMNSFTEDSIISGLSVAMAGISIPPIVKKINQIHSIQEKKDKTESRGVHLRFRGSHKNPNDQDRKRAS